MTAIADRYQALESAAKQSRRRLLDHHRVAGGCDPDRLFDHVAFQVCALDQFESVASTPEYRMIVEQNDTAVFQHQSFSQ